MKKITIIFFFLAWVNSFSQSKKDYNIEAMASYKENQLKAIKLLKTTLKFAQEEKNKELISLTKNNLGIIFRDLGEFITSKKYSNEALQTTKDSIIKASSYINIGACNRKLGLYKDAISNYLNALKIYEAKKSLKEIATANNNIAIVYSYLNLNKKSLEYYNKAKHTFENLNDKKGISQTYNNIAIVYANEGKLETSLKNFRYSLQIEKN
ncbi:tetratricopeptide repeat protein [Polaribacter ponticola]|uniref:Tetratricopeptide repeat protein n=1 Tax=Polaribacter ponticola TaxID=2978475 RepID=A0ABT5SCP1_9FLAO|nr:tetratricopeptide repeat protein [Polaribacter sp. MSW5]MDD7915843.1 tetratricopeptide repeat protein [Polaribacter sp. MSW5]